MTQNDFVDHCCVIYLFHVFVLYIPMLSFYVYIFFAVFFLLLLHHGIIKDGYNDVVIMLIELSVDRLTE